MAAGEPIDHGDEEQDPTVDMVSRRSVLRRALALSISAPVVLTLLQACGDDDDDDDDEEPTATSEAVVTETEPADETPATTDGGDEGTPVSISADGGAAAPTTQPLPEPQFGG